MSLQPPSHRKPTLLGSFATARLRSDRLQGFRELVSALADTRSALAESIELGRLRRFERLGTDAGHDRLLRALVEPLAATLDR